MSYNQSFTKANLDQFFMALAKAYRKEAKKHAVPLEMVLIGGASILVNYEFREATTDIDAVFPMAQVLKDAIKRVGEQYELEPHWLNSDFIKTSSYSQRIIELSQPYKSYLGLLHVRTIKDQHLIAMKLMAGRQYKHDLSDIIGILAECQLRNQPIDWIMIEKAVLDLYGSTNKIKQESWDFLKIVMDKGDFVRLYDEYRQFEAEKRMELLQTRELEASYQVDDNRAHLLNLIKIRKQDDIVVKTHKAKIE